MARQRKEPVTRRGKNLTDDAIEQIVRILDGWTDRLTWDALIDVVAIRLHYRYTRQALHKHERVKVAYALRKETLSGARKSEAPRGSGQLGEARVRIVRLEAENQRLEAENQRLLEQFVVWAYNAHTRGLDKKFLNQPLPHVNRDQTIESKLAKRVGRKA